MRRLVTTFAAMLLLTGIAAGQSGQQLSFEIGHHRPVVKHPVSFSDADLAALRQATVREVTMMGFASTEDAGSPPLPKLTREGLEAAAVHLNGQTERDLVVIGSGRRYARHMFLVDSKGRHPIGDLDRFPIWIIREDHGKPDVVLAVFTRWMEIRPSTDHGLAVIAVSGNMPGLVVFFQFEGDKYVYGGASSD